MRCGNCYLYAVRRYRQSGGWIVLRRSVKARWVIHAQLTASIKRLKASVETQEGAPRTP